MLTIVFQTDQIDLRGTCISLFDYAHFNETILGNKSIIVYNKNNETKNRIQAVIKFRNRFPTLSYRNNDELNVIIKRYSADMFYSIKYGKMNDAFTDIVPCAIHCVFDMSEPHGAAYAGVSKHLADRYVSKSFVPHMVNLPVSIKTNMRKELNIPEDAFVYGRHGGSDTFDLQFVKDLIYQTVNSRSDIWFVFLNTPAFCNHPHVLFLEGTSVMSEKVRFINTCDAMIHAQSLGETFGLSVGEFSIMGKPVVTFTGPQWHRCHLEILKDKAIGYENLEDLHQIFTTLNHDNVPKITDTEYSSVYSPAVVIQKFKEEFIDKCIPEH